MYTLIKRDSHSPVQLKTNLIDQLKMYRLFRLRRMMFDTNQNYYYSFQVIYY